MNDEIKDAYNKWRRKSYTDEEKEFCRIVSADIEDFSGAVAIAFYAGYKAGSELREQDRKIMGNLEDRNAELTNDVEHLKSVIHRMMEE